MTNEKESERERTKQRGDLENKITNYRYLLSQRGEARGEEKEKDKDKERGDEGDEERGRKEREREREREREKGGTCVLERGWKYFLAR